MSWVVFPFCFGYGYESISKPVADANKEIKDTWQQEQGISYVCCLLCIGILDHLIVVSCPHWCFVNILLALCSLRLELLCPAAFAIPPKQLFLPLWQTVFLSCINTLYYMLLHKSKWYFIQLILVIEQQLSYSIFACTLGMRSLWPMKKVGGKKERNHHYFIAAYYSLFLKMHHCILFQSIAANTAIVEFSIFQKMSPKRIRCKQPVRENCHVQLK